MGAVAVLGGIWEIVTWEIVYGPTGIAQSGPEGPPGDAGLHDGEPGGLPSRRVENALSFRIITQRPCESRPNAELGGRQAVHKS